MKVRQNFWTRSTRVLWPVDNHVEDLGDLDEGQAELPEPIKLNFKERSYSCLSFLGSKWEITVKLSEGIRGRLPTTRHLPIWGAHAHKFGAPMIANLGCPCPPIGGAHERQFRVPMPTSSGRPCLPIRDAHACQFGVPVSANSGHACPPFRAGDGREIFWRIQGRFI